MMKLPRQHAAADHLQSGVAVAVLAMLVLFTAPEVFAHSFEKLQSMLREREKYFQPIDRMAPGFTLRDADGETVRLADFRGKVVVLHFIYASCPDVCPLHAERIAEVQELANQTPMKAQVQFVSITTDPVNDRPDVLREYGPTHGLDPANWSFLTTRPEQPEEATRRLAQAYGHEFTKTDDGYQAHGIVTHVIDQQGRWRGNFHGLEFQPVNLVMFINALVNEAQVPHAHDEPSWWDTVKSWF